LENGHSADAANRSSARRTLNHSQNVSQQDSENKRDAERQTDEHTDKETAVFIPTATSGAAPVGLFSVKRRQASDQALTQFALDSQHIARIRLIYPLIPKFFEYAIGFLFCGLRPNGVVVREVLGSHPGPATILLGSNLGQVVYSHCLPSLLSSKKLGYKREYSD